MPEPIPPVQPDATPTPPATPPGGVAPAASPQPTKRSPWDVLLITVILAALLGLTFYVCHHYAQNSTNAATILGIVIPAFATIGAAVFGITVAYSAGNTQGQTKGAADAKSETASQLAGPLQKALDAVTASHAQLAAAGTSPAGTTDLLLGGAAQPGNEPQPVSFDPNPLISAKSEIESAQRYLGLART